MLPERTLSQEVSLENLPQVALAGNTVGHLMNEPGARISLRQIFGEKVGEAVRIVYFRTSSGNLYQLDKGRNKEGEDVLFVRSAKDAVSRGPGIGRENYADFERQLNYGELQIGEHFLFHPPHLTEGNTTTVIEAVIVDPRTQDTESISKLPNNDIINEYLNIVKIREAEAALRKTPVNSRIIQTKL